MPATAVPAPSKVGSIVLAILLSGTAALAEPAEPIPYCVTNAGPSGVVFDGFPSVIAAPNGFIRVEASSDEVWVMDEVLASNSVLIFGKSSGESDTAVSTATVLNFLRADGEPAHSGV